MFLRCAQFSIAAQNGFDNFKDCIVTCSLSEPGGMKFAKIWIGVGTDFLKKKLVGGL